MARPPGPAPLCGTLWTCFDKLFTIMLISANFFLAGYVGAALVTVARLRYDPATYIVLRELLPPDQQVPVDLLLLAAAGLLALLHLPLLALVMPRCLRFFMLMLYALAMLGLAGAEAWAAQRVWDKINGYIREGHEKMDFIFGHLHFLLDMISSIHHFTWKLKSILWEVQRDGPKNLELVQRAFLYFIGFQAVAGVSAILTAITGRGRARVKQHYC